MRSFATTHGFGEALGPRAFRHAAGRRPGLMGLFQALSRRTTPPRRGDRTGVTGANKTTPTPWTKKVSEADSFLGCFILESFAMMAFSSFLPSLPLGLSYGDLVDLYDEARPVIFDDDIPPRMRYDSRRRPLPAPAY